MKKRSKAGSEQVKGRRPKTPEPKRRNVPKTASGPHSPLAAGKTEVARLTRELSEERSQLTATSDVLRVISSSPGNLELIFATMLENAVRLCDASFGTINRWDGESLHLVTAHNAPPAFVEFRKNILFHPGPENPVTRRRSALHRDSAPAGR